MKNTIYRANYNILHSLMVGVFSEKYYANKLLEKEFRQNRKLGARDRKFLAENLYDIVRWWRKLLTVCSLHESHFVNDKFFSDEDIDYILASWFVINGWALPEFLDKYQSAAEKAHARWKKNQYDFAVKHSFCDFFANKLRSVFGDEATELAANLNTQAHIYIRVNTNLTTPVELVSHLAKEGVEVEPVSGQENCLRLVVRKNLFITNSFKKGYFEVQDKGSQMIAPLLDVAPGMRVIDACAGAGGKTLHLASLMKNKGKIISLDIHEWKLHELKLRARRNKISIIEGKAIHSSKVIKRLKGQADRLLLDVPCSGSGVIKRNPDSKWKFSQSRLDELKNTQKDIISRYSKMVKNEGKMVYATCSIFPEENQKIVEEFLLNNTDWTFQNEILVNPKSLDSDGFYAALLEKKS